MPKQLRTIDHGDPLLSRAVEWLNLRLSPYIGSAEIGSWDAGVEQLAVAERPCPICERPMGDHLVEHDAETGHTFLHHPTGDDLEPMDLG